MLLIRAQFVHVFYSTANIENGQQLAADRICNPLRCHRHSYWCWSLLRRLQQRQSIDVRLSANKRDVFQYLQDEFSSAQIESFLKHLSNVPHLAETEQDRQQAEGLRDQFLDFGLDQVTVVPYHVLLSYPDMEKTE